MRHIILRLYKYILPTVLCAIILLFSSCSKPTPFLVTDILDAETIVLENGAEVKLIGVSSFTERYKQALLELKNSYVFLYDENADPIKEIYEGSIYAYVYNQEYDCINNLAEGGTSSEAKVTTSIPSEDYQPQVEESSHDKERVSGETVSQMDGASLSELYDKNKNAVFLVAVFQTETEYAQGSGFFITEEGIGVSNYHVFEGGMRDEAYIKTIDERQYRVGEILKYDQELDFIVFKVINDHQDFPCLRLSASKPNVGEDVFAIGNPKGLEHTLSKGIVSSYRENETKIQTTTDITHGSSGGPLFNMNGEVIGITTSGVGEANLNFAMNIQKLGIKELVQ